MRLRVLITRPTADADPLAELLEDKGFEVVLLPTLSVVPVEDQSALHAALRRLDSYRWVLFTSQNTVQVVLEEMAELGVSVPRAVRVGAVGPRTASALRTAGIQVHCVPPEASGTAFAQALLREGVRGDRVLLPAGSKSRPELPDALRAGGAEVHVVTVYRTSLDVATPAEPMRRLRGGEIDVVALASPSAFSGLLSMLGDDASPLRRVRLVCIGPTTASAVREAGFEVAAVAEPRTAEGLADAIANLREIGTRDDRL